MKGIMIAVALAVIAVAMPIASAQNRESYLSYIIWHAIARRKPIGYVYTTRTRLIITRCYQLLRHL